jgi:ectoine hydroxylase-related dioxygenase (phytanoyl-CoA dioxygenase family)
VTILRSLLGEDYAILREASAHYDFYSNWHKDTTSQEKAGCTFQHQRAFLMVEVAYYLQDNTQEFGGGLDVQPGTHKRRDLFVRPPTRLERAWDRVFERTEVCSIPSKAGDLVIFDFRINHRATRALRTPERPEDKKLAIFYPCSRNNEHVGAYHDFISSRPDYAYLKEFSYRKELVEEARACGLNLA